MKKNIVFGIIGWLLASIGSYKAVAQQTDANAKTETQEIIIRKNGEKDARLTIEITNSKVLINGKPIAEFNEEGLTVNNRKMIYRDGNKLRMDFGDKLKMEIDDEMNRSMAPGGFYFNLDNSKTDAKPYTYLGISTQKNSEGVLITEVAKNSPAEKAGLQKGDVIYKIDGLTIDNEAALTEMIRGKKDADKVKIFFLRAGKKKDEKVTLQTISGSTFKNYSYSYNMPNGKQKKLTITKKLQPLSPGMPEMEGLNKPDFFEGEDFKWFFNKQKLGIKIQDTEDGGGVKILQVDSASAAAAAGLQENDIVTEIAEKKITNTDEAREQLQQVREKSNYSIKAKRNGNEMMFNIKIPKKLKTASL